MEKIYGIEGRDTANTGRNMEGEKEASTGRNMEGKKEVNMGQNTLEHMEGTVEQRYEKLLKKVNSICFIRSNSWDRTKGNVTESIRLVNDRWVFRNVAKGVGVDNEGRERDAEEEINVIEVVEDIVDADGLDEIIELGNVENIDVLVREKGKVPICEDDNTLDDSDEESYVAESGSLDTEESVEDELELAEEF